MTLHDEAVERVALGTFITYAEIQGEGFELLTPEDFFVPKHRELFAACVDMDAHGETITAETVGAWLTKTGQKPLQIALANVLGETVLPNAFRTNARTVREFSIRREAIATANALKLRAENMSEDVFEAIDKADTTLMELGGVMKSSKPEPIGSVLSDVMTSIEQIRNGERKTFGLSTGNPELDSAIGGFRGGKLIIIAGRPSQGKSALVASGLRNASKEGGVALMSLEMGSEEVAMRLLSQESKVAFYRIEHAKLMEDHVGKIAHAVKVLSGRNFIIEDAGSLTLPTLRARVKELAMKGVKVIAVDYLQLMTAPKADTRDIAIGMITKTMKNLARDFDICLVCLSQLNRAVETRNDRRPTLADLRESGNIEQDADTVIFVTRPETYNPDDSSLEGKATLILAKNRNGVAGIDIEAYFDKETMDFRAITPRFDNLAPEGF